MPRRWWPHAPAGHLAGRAVQPRLPHSPHTWGGMRCHMLRSTVARSDSSPPATTALASMSAQASALPGARAAHCALPSHGGLHGPAPSRLGLVCNSAITRHAMPAARDPHACDAPEALHFPALTAIVARLCQAPHQACQVCWLQLIQRHSRWAPQRRVCPPQHGAGRAIAQAAKGPQRPGEGHRRAGAAGRLWS